MKSLLFRTAIQWIVILVGSMNIAPINSFVVSPQHTFSSMQPVFTHDFYKGTDIQSCRERGETALFSSTSTKPLYDGTNYTFPDTTTSAGVAELLEVSFVHACMQLASGYVDVLKMFIAASIGAYEAGFSIDSIVDELENNKDMPNTANRPLMDEEKMLRRDWLCVIYLTLAAMDHKSPIGSSLSVSVAKESIPEDIQKRYGDLVSKIGEAYKSNSKIAPTVEDLCSDNDGNADLSPLEKAVLMQSLKVATLTPVVVEESKEARGSGTSQKAEVKPPTPPIEGAF